MVHETINIPKEMEIDFPNNIFFILFNFTGFTPFNI